MPANNESARGRIAAARERAAAARDRVRVAAIKGAGWKILEFFAQNTTAWGALFYVLLSSIGVTYSWAFYSQFKGIRIFDFFDTSDFLLSAFQNVGMLMIGIIATVISIGLPLHRVRNSIVYAARDFDIEVQQSHIRREARGLLIITLASIVLTSLPLLKWALASTKTEWEWLGSIIYLIIYLTSAITLCGLAYRFFKIAQTPAIWDGQFRWAEVILLFLIPIGATFILPFLYGKADGHAALGERSRLVRVTISQDAAQSQTRLPIPEHTLFLGTTSSFHFFYECENALTAKNTPKCGDGKPFIVPTANVASLSFNLQKGESEDSLSTVVSAITELNRTISSLSLNATINTSAVNIGSGDVTFDTTQVAEAVTILNKTIENLQLRIAPDPALGQVAKAIITLSKTIENLQPQTTLDHSPDKIAEAIRTLSETIKSLKLPNPSNPDPDMTAVLKALTATLRTLDATITSLNVKGVQNRCASSLEKVDTIGPFSEGKHEPDSRTAAKLTQRIGVMNSRFEKEIPQHLMLIGRVDSSQLSEENLQFYGAQRELAKARAEWVQGELLKKFPTQIDSRRITLLSRNYREKNKESGRRAHDRSVEVWACWASEQPEPTNATVNSGG